MKHTSKSPKGQKISIVIPSYNQGQFIAETIQSIVAHVNIDIELIVVDGGSTDNTLDVIDDYSSYISTWVSEKDRGQAHAINKGFAMATGDIFAWLNSDDMYLPGAINEAISRLDTTKAELMFGNSLLFDIRKESMWGSNVIQEAASYDLKLVDFIIQPSAFWTRKAWEQVGKLNESLHYTFDWDWFIRAELSGVAFKNTTKYLSLYRVHDSHKTGTGGESRKKEIIEVLEKYNGTSIVNLCKRIGNKGSYIKQLEYYLNKFRLKKVEKILLHIIFPTLFFRHSYCTIKSLTRMI